MRRTDMIGNQAFNPVKQLSVKQLSAVREFIMLIILALIIVILSILSPAFADANNFINIFKQAAINGILATGMMCVILRGV